MAVFTITTGEQVNQPPSQIGDVVINLTYNELYTFTVADFTTNTTPQYQDPEGDDIEEVQAKSPVLIGSLTRGGVPVINGTIITKAQLEAGDLKYLAESSDIDGYTESGFTFDISDVGSSTFSGLTPGIVTFIVGAKDNEAPTTVGNGSATIDYGETLVFTRAMLTSSLVPAYSDPEGDAAGQLLIKVLPAEGTLKLNGVDVVVNQIIDFTDIDSGLFIYDGDLTDTDGSIENFEFQIADVGSGIFVG